MSRGRCKLCGAEREFRNVGLSDWGREHSDAITAQAKSLLTSIMRSHYGQRGNWSLDEAYKE